MQLLLVFMVAVLNMALGYALAVRFGWELIGLRPSISAEMIDNGLDDEDDLLPFDEPADEDVESETIVDQSPNDSEKAVAELPDREKGFLESTFDGFQHLLADFAAGLVHRDTQLRGWQATPGSQAPDSQDIEQLRTELMATVESYRASQQDGNNLLKDERDELGDLTALGDRLELAVDEHCELIDAVQHRIDNQAVQDDADSDGSLLIDEIGNMLTSCHSLRDLLTAGQQDIARQEGRA